MILVRAKKHRKQYSLIQKFRRQILMINGPKQNLQKNMTLFFLANRVEKEHEGYPGNRFFLLLFHSPKIHGVSCCFLPGGADTIYRVSVCNLI